MIFLASMTGVIGTMAYCFYKEEKEERKKKKILNIIQESDKYEYSEDKVITCGWFGKEIFDKNTKKRVARIASADIRTGYDGWYQPVQYIKKLSEPRLVRYDKEVFKHIK